MNQDELLAKFLDGNLNAGEQAQLQSLLDSSPALAEELRALEGLEQALSTSNSPLAADDLSFLNEVGQRAVDAIPMTPPPTGGMESLAGKLGSTLAGKMAGIGGAIVIASGAGVAVWQMQSQEDTSAPAQETQQLIEDIDQLPDLNNSDLTQETPAAVEAEIPEGDVASRQASNPANADAAADHSRSTDEMTSDGNSADPLAVQSADDGAAAVDPTEIPAGPDDGSKTLHADVDSDDGLYEKDLQNLTQEFRQAQASGDNVTLAQKALQLGKLLEGRSAADSRRYYSLAFTFAQHAGLPAVERSAKEGLLRLVE